MSGSDSLAVELSREKLHAIETADAFESEGAFVVTVTNHGRDAHVHVRFDGNLARAAGTETEDSNYYVERDGTVEIEVSVDPKETPASGQLTIETGYGAESESVDVSVSEPPDAGVRVDEQLNEPAPDDGGRPSLLPVAGLALTAIGVAAVAALVVEDPVVLVGVAAVLAGVVVAMLLLLR